MSASGETDERSVSPRSSLVDVSTCQICGSERSEIRFVDGHYQVKRCSDCSLVYVSPRWSDEKIHEVYSEDYWISESPKTKGYADYKSEAELYLKTFRRRMRLVHRFVPVPARVLDVGCAAGYFLRVMQEAGHDVHGVELSRAIATEAIKHLGGDRIHIGTLDSVHAPDGKPGYDERSFDLVTLWDVVEHVPDPQSLLRAARAMLKPGGHLILETQNVCSRFASLLGPRWHHYKHEEHLYHFNPATVRMLLDQAGFRVAKLTSSYGGKYVSLGFIAERAGRLNRMASLALRPLALMRRANLYLNFRDEMVVVATPHEPAAARSDGGRGTAPAGRAGPAGDAGRADDDGDRVGRADGPRTVDGARRA